MPVSDERVLMKDISLKKLSKVYVLYGNDSFLPKYYCDKLGDIACTGDPFFNRQTFDADCDLQDVYDAVKQYSMMSDSKVVILNDYDFTKCDKSEFQKLLTIISEVEDGCVFILLFSNVVFDIKKDSKAKKIMSESEKLGGKVISLDHRTVSALVKMLVSGAKKRGAVLSDKNAGIIIEKCGEDISVLKNELDKLCAYKNGGEISLKDIDFVCMGSVDASVYDYVGFIAAGNVVNALKSLDNMFYLRMEPIFILYSVSSVYVDMYRVFTATKKHKNKSDIAEDFSYKNRAFVLNKAYNSVKRYDYNMLHKSFNCILDADRKIKSSIGGERLVLEEMTVQLALILRGDNQS